MAACLETIQGNENEREKKEIKDLIFPYIENFMIHICFSVSLGYLDTNIL